ncbi:MAG TPA: hypothetical protein VFD67_07410 [Gemmatimonadaceae bacterium]|nr:hypothetical protein [Gemmatimonadaceae bacterium]
MRQFIERLSLSTACVIALAACSHFRHQNTTTYDVTPAGSSSGSAARLASEYGCTAGQVTSNWQSARLEIAKPGTPICNVLGRYGDPISVSKNAIADMQLVSMLHREPNGRYYNATFVYYADTKVNRQLNRPIGKWIVDRVSATK